MRSLLLWGAARRPDWLSYKRRSFILGLYGSLFVTYLKATCLTICCFCFLINFTTIGKTSCVVSLNAVLLLYGFFKARVARCERDAGGFLWCKGTLNGCLGSFTLFFSLAHWILAARLLRRGRRQDRLKLFFGSLFGLSILQRLFCVYPVRCRCE